MGLPIFVMKMGQEVTNTPRVAPHMSRWFVVPSWPPLASPQTTTRVFCQLSPPVCVCVCVCTYRPGRRTVIVTRPCTLHRSGRPDIGRVGMDEHWSLGAILCVFLWRQRKKHYNGSYVLCNVLRNHLWFKLYIYEGENDVSLVITLSTLV